MQLLFYGAGEHAKKNIDFWLRRGLEPTCFIDIDKTKHYIKFDEKFDILPLTEAIQKYPDYLICVALGIYNYDAGHKYLLESGIPSERIVSANEFSLQGLRRYYSRSGESVFSCSRISRPLPELILKEDCIQICCSLDAIDQDFFFIPFTNVVDGILKAHKVIDDINDMHRRGNSGPCKGCYHLRNTDMDIVHTPANLRTFTFSADYIGSTCNMRCVYCTIVDNINHNYTKDKTMMNAVVNIVDFFSDDLIRLDFVSGEFFAKYDSEDILKYLIDKENVKISLVTNASIYSETFLELIRLNRVYLINVSLDAGTEETYRKVKGRDLFRKVVNNIEMYSQFRSQIDSLDLKYIFLAGVNDSYEDIEGFIAIAERIKCTIHISADQRASVRKSPLPKATMDSIFMLYNLAVERKLKVIFMLEAFNADDSLYIKSHVNS